MFFILIIVVGMVAWALHLMQAAIQSREFSLMLAGFLVSVAAAATMSVYFLVGHYVGYMTQMHHSYPPDVIDSASWLDSAEIWSEDWIQAASTELESSF